MKIWQLLMVALLVTGCSRTMVSNVKTYTYDASGDPVADQQQCIDLCLERQRTNDGRGIMGSGTYRCDYKPVTCNEDTCLCETY